MLETPHIKSLLLAAPVDPPPVFPSKHSALGVRGRLTETEPVPVNRLILPFQSRD